MAKPTRILGRVSRMAEPRAIATTGATSEAVPMATCRYWASAKSISAIDSERKALGKADVNRSGACPRREYSENANASVQAAAATIQSSWLCWPHETKTAAPPIARVTTTKRKSSVGMSRVGMVGATSG